MKITNNHRIISLYSTVFIIISIITIYLPVWLHEVIGIQVKQIGYLFALTGILKLFSNILITKNIKSYDSYKITSLYLVLIILFLYSLIIFLLNKNQQPLIIILIFLSLMVSSPLLPIAESICLNLNRNFFNSYGKLRISGSIAFF